MRVVSFNVNSVRQRIAQLEAVIKHHNPLVIALQETKVSDADFPRTEIESLGYHVEYHGQKTHYGVATLTRSAPVQVVKGFEGDEPDAQCRWIGVQLQDASGRPLWVYNGYFPQGESRDHPVKFPAKARFYENVLARLNAEHTQHDRVLVVGDFNVAAEDRDIGIGPDNAKRWIKTGKASFLPEEREWLQALCDWGLVDTFRACHPKRDDCFSWFDYRSRGFEREPKRGLRIDAILATPALAEHTHDAGSDYAIRAMTKPSDHCPIWSEFND